MGCLIAIETLDHRQQFPAYCAEPAGPARAAIIVIQEIFGVNAGIRSKCDRWAEAGYLAVAPDLFWRFRPGIELDPDVPEQFEEGLNLYQRFDQDQGVVDIDATIRATRARSKGIRVGCVGYCLGGRLAFMTAARTDVDASVGYYGVGIDGLLGEKEAITHPVLLHVPTDDQFVNDDTQKAMHRGLDGNPLVTIYDYPGLHHGFAVASGKRRNERAAQLADDRTAAFFAANLG
ncbi:MAG: dienelactone hydrolase family protein [Burkholderiales bacterium]